MNVQYFQQVPCLEKLQWLVRLWVGKIHNTEVIRWWSFQFSGNQTKFLQFGFSINQGLTRRKIINYLCLLLILTSVIQQALLLQVSTYFTFINLIINYLSLLTFFSHLLLFSCTIIKYTKITNICRLNSAFIELYDIKLFARNANRQNR